MRWRSGSVSLLVLFVALSSTSQVSLAAGGETSADDVWTTISVEELNATGTASTAVPWIRPDKFTAVALNPGTITAALALAPTILTLPRPDGGFERFLVSAAAVMHPDLEQWMAEQGWPMKTYSATSLDNPATTARLDWGGPAGFHAMVRAPGGDYFVDPYWQGDMRLYSSYFQRDYTLQGRGQPWSESGYFNPGSVAGAFGHDQTDTRAFAPTGGLLRSYRIAVAGTAAYTAFNGGTKALGQAAIVTSVNRLNGLYENELSVSFQLVANNQDIVFVGSDSYTSNVCDGTMLDENQVVVDNAIGSGNYDIGHVFGQRTGGGGGLAQGQSVCSAGKAKGCSSVPNPKGDGFDLGIVAHEVGHQFGAGHTFTGQGSASCNTAFDGGSSYEPGSGSTIMSYFGLCSADDNLEPPTGNYFHRISLDQMGTFVNDPVGGGLCETTGGIVNANEPVVNAGADYTIPIGTPFELTGSGTDADGDTLTFNWEQFDLGVQKPLNTGDDGVQPLFRSFPPSTTGNTRVFPRLDKTFKGETLPATNRTMNFRLTARDNKTGGAREDDDLALITSTTTAGPFKVTAPDNGTETYAPGSAQTVTWNVAGTDSGAVNTPNVDILLSHDGGVSYAETLVSNTPNDGSEGVTIPTTISSASARVKAKGVDNVFFDISDNDFSVGAQCRTPGTATVDGGSITDTISIAGGKTIADLNVKLDLDHTWVGELTVTLQHVNATTSVTLIDRPGVPGLSIDGCFYDNILADLDDEGSAPAEDQCAAAGVNPPGPGPAAIVGRLKPNNLLSAFDGEDIGGDWKLTVTTAGGFGETGTLNKWCIDGWFGTPPTGCPNALLLDNDTLNAPQTYQGKVSATLGPALTIDGPGIVVRSPTIIIGDGVTIGGTFEAGNVTTCP